MIGKNAPCPCGSGRKYKRCCMGKRSESRSLGQFGPTRVDEVRRDVPVVDEDGARIVSPAQASMDFAKPLWEEFPPETPEQAQNLLNIGMGLWNLALERRRGSESQELRKTVLDALIDSGVPSPAEFLDRMIERHVAMFPDAGSGRGSFYEREIVVDELPAWTPFVEDRLPQENPPAGDTDADQAALRVAGEFDGLLRKGDTDALLGDLQRIGGTIEQGFGDWLERWGVEADDAVSLAEVVGMFLHFLAQYRGEPLDEQPEAAGSEFLMTWLFRKARIDGRTHSAAPAALELFGSYLDALGHTEALGPRMRAATAPLLDSFRETLSAFYGPASDEDDR